MKAARIIPLLVGIIILVGCEKEPAEDHQPLPEVRSEVIKKSETVVTFKGFIDNQGTYTVTEKGFYYSSTPESNSNDTKVTCPGAFSADISTLKVGETYYARAFAVFNENTTVLGNIVEVSITGEEAGSVSLTTDEPVVVSDGINEFIASATIEVEGNVKIVTKGFVYSHDNQSPLLEKDHSVFVGYIFERNISVQTINMDTWVRSFATTSTDTIYGNSVKVPPFEALGYPGMKLTWSEEFDYEGKPDSKNWNFESGFARNQELQWYTADNAICRDGKLIITGKKERVKNPNYNPHATGTHAWKETREYAEYTSTSMTTSGKFEFKYGRLEVRAKIPTASGSWPAIWTVGAWYEWPFGGEIDILEYYPTWNGTPSVHANACWGSDTRWSGWWDSANIPFSEIKGNDGEWENKFHVWRMDWDYDEINIYLDERQINSIDLNNTVNGNPWDLPDGKGINPFRNHPHYLFLNLAIGSNGGTPNDAAFPLSYEVDFVRYYEYD